MDDQLTLFDEAGQAWTFRALRALRDRGDCFIVAEREGTGTLHVLQEEDGRVGLVRDEATLGRVALRIEILRRAMEGELVEWSREDGGVAFLGVFHRGTTAEGPYLLAADLVDPATIVALEIGPDGTPRAVDERRRIEIEEQLESTLRDWEVARPDLEAAVRGLRPEHVEVTDASGRRREGRAALRLRFEGRDVLFLAFDDEPGRAVAATVHEHGRLEWIADKGFLGRLRGLVESLRA